ncbi:nucleotide kinase domain-containing protein [Paeniglutamicibacter gangotriensis]|uniref:nucleotide kinase domain-containing protein n=1 Tax=Paeniglutamicibacter gangotriensis TaxID=254787 RepID=UPI0037CC7996
MRILRVGSRRVVASPVLKSYWHLAYERQEIYFRRLSGFAGPWTDDPVLRRYRFTNAFRAADRVSQALIRVMYEGSRKPEDLVFRTLLFRFFNKPSTWSALEAKFGQISWASFDLESYSNALDSLMSRGMRIYSAAYIVPPPPFGAARKHRNHLLLIEHMMQSGIVTEVLNSQSLKDVYDAIHSYPSLGPFLAYQLTIDLNYSDIINFDENDFVVAGPGARSGLAKCFLDKDGLSDEDLIRLMADTQEQQFEQYDFGFRDLFGRSLKLIDCQNLFCETDKYARAAHPEAQGLGNRTRIKQQFNPAAAPEMPYFPPKWGINAMASGYVPISGATLW